MKLSRNTYKILQSQNVYFSVCPFTSTSSVACQTVTFEFKLKNFIFIKTKSLCCSATHVSNY